MVARSRELNGNGTVTGSAAERAALIDRVQRDRTERAEGEEGGKAGKANKNKKELARADKMAENLFRISHAKHQSLSAMADNKAHLMLTISVGIIGVSATQVFDPQLQYTALTLIVANMIVAGLAVFATMPSLPHQQIANPKNPEFNLIFFSDFANLPYETFEREMRVLLRDREEMSRALVRDLYVLGRLLNGKKYRYLALCYRAFIAGLVLAGLVLAATLISNWA